MESTVHKKSMEKWAEALNRQKSKTSVAELVSGNVLQYRRNYMKKILEVLTLMIRFYNNICFEMRYSKKCFFRLLYF